MAPRQSKSEKQSDRKAEKRASKVDDEAAVAGDGLLAAVKQLALGSVLVEVLPTLPKLLKGGEEPVAAAKEEDKENKEDNDEKTPLVAAEEKPTGAASVFESLATRLPIYGALGLDKTPDEEFGMFTRLEVDFGPFKRKKGNAALERIVLNVERNLSQYINIALALMVLNALVFRSYFACLPWLVGYQLLSLNIPMDLIRDQIPQLPPVDVKFRVAATMAIHALVWFFFLYEVLFATYFLAKFPLIGLFVIHAYIVVPEVNLEAARTAVQEKKTAEAGEAKPEPTKGAANAGSFIQRIKTIVKDSFLSQLSRDVPELIKDLKGEGATPKKAEEKKAEGDEKETNEPRSDKEGSYLEKYEGYSQIGCLSLYNVLGLGHAASAEDWGKLVDKKAIDFGPKAKKGSPVKERLMTNFESFMHMYLHITVGLMCVRSFLFRSWFACLPWLMFYQTLCLSFNMIRTKFPQVPPLTLKIRIAATGVIHTLMWLFFAYEAAFMTHFFEKFLLSVLFIAHAYVVSPVVD